MAKSENICNASDSMAVMDYSHGCHGLFSMSYILHPQVKSKSLCSEKFGMRQTHLGQTETEVVTKYYLLASRTINLTLHRKYHSSDQLSQTISFLKPRSTYNMHREGCYSLGQRVCHNKKLSTSVQSKRPALCCVAMTPQHSYSQESYQEMRNGHHLHFILGIFLRDKSPHRCVHRSPAYSRLQWL